MQEILSYFRDNWLALAAFVLSVASLAFTIRRGIKDRRYANDKELVEQLKQSLRLAYEAVAATSGSPTNLRTRWLTSARHIVRYRELKRFLRTKLYSTICDEQEEYWNDKFYDLLRKITESTFFEAVDPEAMEKEQIEPTSAAIVYSMSVWRKDKPDPIDAETFESIVKRYELFSPLYIHFREYILQKHPALADKAKRLVDSTSACTRMRDKDAARR